MWGSIGTIRGYKVEFANYVVEEQGSGLPL